MEHDFSEFKDKVKHLNKFDTHGDYLDQFTFTPIVNSENVNSPSHYTSGRVEAIDIIEDCINDAPDPVYGMLQAQALKYLLRLWLKNNPKEDAEKARWYLNRLIEKL